MWALIGISSAKANSLRSGVEEAKAAATCFANRDVYRRVVLVNNVPVVLLNSGHCI